MAIQLSTNIISQVDIARLLREIKSLDDFFVAASARPAGTQLQLPRLTRMLDQLAKENKYNLLEESHRKTIYQELNNINVNAPLIHISFAAEPSPKALEKVLMWFRTNIHPQSLLQVGLQPAIAAGCVVRTQNKVFDLSLKENLNNQRQLLVQLIDTAAKRN